MDNGRTFLVALISATATYVAMTAWPALTELFNPPAANVPVATASSSVNTPVLSAGVLPSSGAALPVAAPAPPPTPPPSAPSLASSQLADLQTWNRPDMKYARFSVMLRAKPGGVALRPVSLNRAPLTIVKGTRLFKVKEQGAWVMVQAPSAELGWVRSAELSDTRPRVKAE